MKIAAFLTFGQFFFFCILGLSSVKRLSLYGNMISGTSQLKSLNSSAKKICVIICCSGFIKTCALSGW